MPKPVSVCCVNMQAAFGKASGHAGMDWAGVKPEDKTLLYQVGGHTRSLTVTQVLQAYCQCLAHNMPPRRHVTTSHKIVCKHATIAVVLLGATVMPGGTPVALMEYIV